ncbi:MAG: DUF4832 domain-containing protein [Nannocystaceae bacterium]
MRRYALFAVGFALSGCTGGGDASTSGESGATTSTSTAGTTDAATSEETSSGSTASGTASTTSDSTTASTTASTTVSTTTSDPTGDPTAGAGFTCPLALEAGVAAIDLDPPLFADGDDPSSAPVCGILNPERGFHSFADLRTLDGEALDGVLADGHTLIYGQVLIPEYRDKPLDDALLGEVEAGLALVRAKGMKVVPRFHYSDAIDEPDADLERILGHIDQLGPLLEANADVILTLQAGFVGAWGEWHSSQNGLDAPGPRKEILDALLAALPVDRTVTVRRPSFKEDAYGGPLAAETAHDGSALARVGHINDCFLASDDDFGTYQLPGEKDYAIADAWFVPVGGETCAVNPPRSECPSALDELALLHWTHLNADYHPGVLDGWAQGGCYDAIACRLGYRLAVRGLRHLESASPGETVPVAFDLVNDGFAAPVNPRAPTLILDGPIRIEVDADFDLRAALPGETATICVEAILPADAPAGAYQIGLRLADPAPSLADDPRQSIRLGQDEGVEWAEGINWFRGVGDGPLIRRRIIAARRRPRAPGRERATLGAHAPACAARGRAPRTVARPRGGLPSRRPRHRGRVSATVDAAMIDPDRPRSLPADRRGGRSRRAAALALTWAAAVAPGCKPSESPPPPRRTVEPPAKTPGLTAYRFARVITAPGEVVDGGVIVVEGATIREVLAADAAVPVDATVIDRGRYTAIPGLIDAHTHLAFVWLPEWDGHPPRETSASPERALPLAELNARRTLEAGVTTVRDLGAQHHLDLVLAAKIDAGEIVGPRILGASDGIWPKELDNREPDDDSPGPVDGVEAIAAAARARIDGGARVLKIYASTGSDDDLSGVPLYSYEEIKAAVDVAHARGVKVAVHDYLGAGAEDIVRAGADTLEHARDLSDETLARMRERGVVYVPTISHNLYYLENIERLGLDPDVGPRFEAYVAANVETTRRARAAGVTVVMGSDAVFTGHGANTRELDVFVERVGMTPTEALQTATTDAARALGLENQVGAIRPGYDADFVVIDGDLSRIQDVHAVVQVVRRGVMYPVREE